MKIVIAEPLRAAGIELLKAQPGWEIITSSPTEYPQHLADAEVLLASRTAKVTAAQIEIAKKLRVIAFPASVLTSSISTPPPPPAS